jgi:putative glutamine amidotransferase
MTSYRGLVAVVAYHLDERRVGRWPAGGFGVPAPYVEALRSAGARTAILAPGERGDPRELLAPFDGLLLVGGGDVDPAAYGAAPDGAQDYGIEHDRDALEIALLREADRLALPTLCICRGMQVMNVACGGTLHQHLPELLGHEHHRRVSGSFDGADHHVRLLAGSLAARAAGELHHATKSHHHQGIDRLGDGLRVTGWAEIDDLPEAIEAPRSHFALGVQWHPEADEKSRLIAALVEEAAAVRPSER